MRPACPTASYPGGSSFKGKWHSMFLDTRLKGRECGPKEGKRGRASELSAFRDMGMLMLWRYRADKECHCQCPQIDWGGGGEVSFRFD